MKNWINIYNHDYPVDPHCFGQTILINSLAKILNQDFNIYLITNFRPGIGNESFYKMADKYAREGLNVNVIRVDDAETALERYDNYLEAIKSIDGQKIIDHHFLASSPLIRKVKEHKEGKNVVHWHCMFDLYLFGCSSKRRRRNTRELVKNVKENIDANIAVSESVKESFRQITELYNKMIVIKNGVDTTLYNPPTLEEKLELKEKYLGLSKDDLVVGYIGRMQDVKGVEILKEVLRKADEERLDIYFVFGSSNGPDRTKFKEFLEQECEWLIDEERVKVGFDISKFLTNDENLNKFVLDAFYQTLKNDGITQNDEIYGGIFKDPLQKMIDVYFHPAKSEALGLSIIEAQMCGTPTVASKVGGIPEVITNLEYNHLIELPEEIYLRDQKAISRAAEEFLRAIKSYKKFKYSYKVGKNIRKSVLDKFDIKVSAEKIRNLFNSLLQ